MGTQLVQVGVSRGHSVGSILKHPSRHRGGVADCFFITKCKRKHFFFFFFFLNYFKL